eukprot:5109684-Pleurochrysis_carterae.AAC.1
MCGAASIAVQPYKRLFGYWAGVPLAWLKVRTNIILGSACGCVALPSDTVGRKRLNPHANAMRLSRRSNLGSPIRNYETVLARPTDLQ